MTDGAFVFRFPQPLGGYDERNEGEYRRAVEQAFESLALSIITTGGVAWGSITGKPATFAPAAHTHVWTDLTGLPTPAQLGSGTPSASNFLRGDGTWQVPAAGAHTHAAADTVSGIFDTARLGGGSASVSTYLRGNSSWSAIPFSDLTGSIANGQVPAGAVTQHQAALAIGWGQLTGVPANITTGTGTTGKYARWAGTGVLTSANTQDSGPDVQITGNYLTFLTSGTGLYGGASAVYWNQQTSGWRLVSGTTSALIGLTTSGGARGSVFANAGVAVGFLDEAGAERLRIPTGSDINYAFASAHYFYSKDQTTLWGAQDTTGLTQYGARWFRNNTSGYGLINDADSTSLWSHGASGFTLSANAAPQLRLQATGAVTRGYFYGDSTGVGLLDKAGAWALRIDDAANYLYAYRNFAPAGDGNSDLGTASLRWKDAYLYGKLTVDDDANGVQVGSDYSRVFFRTNASTPRVQWKVAAQDSLSDVLEFSHSASTSTAPRSIGSWTRRFWLEVGYATFAAQVRPADDNARDLGSGSYRWRNGYFGSSVIADQMQANAQASGVAAFIATSSASNVGGFGIARAGDSVYRAVLGEYYLGFGPGTGAIDVLLQRTGVGTFSVTGTPAFGAATFSGAVTLSGGVSGAMAATGAVSGTTATFSGALSATSGAFSSTVQSTGFSVPRGGWTQGSGDLLVPTILYSTVTPTGTAPDGSLCVVY